jgi:catechol 2,3-dioxygenase-like lactoylglutathione lyase family enzyme
VDQKLEAIAVPASDIDRTRHFYRALGFRLDFDQVDGAGLRVVRLTPPGSLCSTIMGTGVSSAIPGSTVGVLTVSDLETAVAELRARGATTSPIGQRGDGSRYASFSDPDGNEWLVVDDIPAH